MTYSAPTPYENRIISYTNLGGVDLTSDQREISPHRASKCINMYRPYTDGTSAFLQTRPGFENLGGFGGEIFGIHFLNEKVLVHSENALYLWSSFPKSPKENDLTSLWEMARQVSNSFVFNNKLYILDGQSYLEFDGVNLKAVEGFIPTTKIANNETFQGVNLLSPLRKNSFRGDGAETSFYLDTVNIDSIEEVFINDLATESYTFNLEEGKITFNEAPPEPFLGDDNIVVTYKKEVAGHYERISKCRLALIFDNRVFYSGNDLYPGVIFHSELNDPTYISDINYYDDSNGIDKIFALAIKNNSLFAIKNGGENALYSHTPTLNYSLGRIYPASAHGISLGCTCLGGAYVFKDDLIYLTPYGFEGIYSKGEESYGLSHRSTTIDGKLTSEELRKASICLWQGYLCALINGRMYLADSKNLYYNNSSYEYEWYIWEGLYSKEANNYGVYLKEQDGNLYFGTKEGDICVFTKEFTDEGRAIESLWESRCETASAAAVKKSVISPGGGALFKKIPNSKIDVYIFNDEGKEKKICSVNMGGFDFLNMDFNSLSFSIGEDNLAHLPIREKGFKTLKISLRSKSVFGLGQLFYTARLHNYIK